MTQYRGNDQIRLNSESADRSLTGVAAAWANLNGTGTIALRDSENVASVTDEGTGQYTFNLSNSMDNANYYVNANANRTYGSGTAAGDFNAQAGPNNLAAGSVRVFGFTADATSAATRDTPGTFVGIHGVLA